MIGGVKGDPRVFKGGHVFTFTVALAFPLSHNEAIILYVCLCMRVDISAPPTDKDAGGQADQLTAQPTLTSGYDVKVA